MKGMKNICLMTLVGVLAFLLVFSSLAQAGSNDLEDVDLTSEELMQDDLKQKTVYFHNRTGTVNGNTGVDTMNTTIGEDQYLSDWVYDSTITHEWYLDPPFAGDFQFQNESTIFIWINTREAEGGTNDVTLTLNLYEVEPDSTEHLIGNGTEYYGETRTIFNEYSVSAHTGEYNLSAGSSLRAELVIESSDNFQKRVAYGDSEYPSRVELGTTTYVEPRTLRSMNSTYEEQYNFPLEGDTTIHFNSSVTDPFGGYDIHAVYITIEGPNGTVTYRDEMELVDGTNTSYRLNYTYTWDYSGAEEGEYTAIVSAVDNTGYYYRYPDNPGDETYGGHLESKEKDFWIGAQRYYVHLRTLDSQDQPIEGAEVRILTGGTVDTFNHTDEEGMTNVSMRGGNNTVRVYWQDVLVNETTVNITDHVSRENAFDLSCEVYTPSYRVVDVANEPIENVNLLISHPNGTTLREVTGEDGTVDIPQLPAGEYSIRSEWLTKVVNQTSHDLNSNQLFEIKASVHYMEVRVQDERNEPVSDVHLTFIYDDTERVADADLTNVNGNVTMRLPETDGFAYDIVTRWRGVDVGTEQGEELTQNRTVNIQLEIYYIEVHAVDSTQDSADLNNASLRVYNQETGALANSAVLNSTGRGEVRLPSGDHEFQVYWKGVQVAADTRTVAADMAEQQIVCDVYNLEVEVEDDLQRAVDNARVEIRHGGRLLGELRTQGRSTPEARFPETQLTIRVSWRGVPVNETTYYLDQNSVDDQSYVINASIYQVHFTIEDHHGEELGEASISLFNESSLIASGSADPYGVITMRLPKGHHLTRIEWKNVMVYEETQEIETSTDITVTVSDVYHVDFRALDSEGVEVNRASVVTMIDGEQIDSGFTEGGVFSSRVPTPYGESGDVTVRVHWRDVEVYYDTETISGDRTNDPVELDLAIYYLDYELVDAQGEPVENARIFVRHSEISEGRDLIADRVTDENGSIVFRLPRGEQTFTARWKEITVAEEENFSLISNDALNKTADVYYLDMEVIDDRGEPLVGAEVRITYPGTDKLYQSVHADEDGEAVARIPASEWDVEVKWIDTQIYSDSFTVSEGQTDLQMETSVHYLTIKTTDKGGEKLSDVHVKVISEERVWSGYTENGSITFRLPELPQGESYTIEGSFQTTYLLTDVNVNETDTIELGSTEEPEETISFDDYPIPFYQTNLFIFLGILIVILALIVYLYRKESEPTVEEETEEEELGEPEEETEIETEEEELGEPEEETEVETDEETEEELEVETEEELEVETEEEPEE